MQQMQIGKKHDAAKAAWADWHDAELRGVGPELLEIADKAVNRELDSRRELNARLSATIAFAGLLLAAAFGFGYRAGRFELSNSIEDLLTECFVVSVAALVVSAGVALYALLPNRRSGLNPEVLRYYAEQGSNNSEIRQDAFKVEVSVLRQLEKGNTLRARLLFGSQCAVGVALIVAAAGSLILFFSHGASNEQGRPERVEKEHAPSKTKHRPKTNQAQNLGHESSRGSSGKQQGRALER